MQPIARTVAVASSFLLAGSPGLFAADIHVPADYPTIQGAIDAATNGDEVLVDPGTYAESYEVEVQGSASVGSAEAAKNLD